MSSVKGFEVSSLRSKMDEPMRWIPLLLVAAASLAAGFSHAPAFAQDHAGTTQEQQACSRDASRFCRKDLGNDSAVQACLEAHRGKLSSACRKVFESHGR